MYVSPAVCRNNVIYVIDRSGSVVVDEFGKPENWREVRSFLRNLTVLLQIDAQHTEVGAVLFNDKYVHRATGALQGARGVERGGGGRWS